MPAPSASVKALHLRLQVPADDAGGPRAYLPPPVAAMLYEAFAYSDQYG